MPKTDVYEVMDKANRNRGRRHLAPARRIKFRVAFVFSSLLRCSGAHRKVSHPPPSSVGGCIHMYDVQRADAECTSGTNLSSGRGWPERNGGWHLAGSRPCHAGV